MKLKIMSLLAVLLILLTGCDFLPSASGTYTLDPNDIASIQVTNGAGKSFTIQDQATIRSLTKLIGALTLDTPADAASADYTLDITYRDGAEAALPQLSVSGDTAVTTHEGTFTVDAEDLMTQLEKLECATLTDHELLQHIFEDNYWDTVTITNEKGELSVDQILRLPEQCPALFELISRPSAMKSLAGDGMALLEKYASSTDEALRARAEKLGEIFANLKPEIKQQIADLLERFQ